MSLIWLRRVFIVSMLSLFLYGSLFIYLMPDPQKVAETKISKGIVVETNCVVAEIDHTSMTTIACEGWVDTVIISFRDYGPVGTKLIQRCEGASVTGLSTGVFTFAAGECNMKRLDK